MATVTYTPDGLHTAMRVDAFSEESSYLATGVPIYRIHVANQHNRRISVLTSYDKYTGELRIDIVETGV